MEPNRKALFCNLYLQGFTPLTEDYCKKAEDEILLISNVERSELGPKILKALEKSAYDFQRRTRTIWKKYKGNISDY